MARKENIVNPSPEQIANWKNLHVDVYKITTDSGKKVYLRKPKRTDLSYASAAGAQDPLKFNEAILENCWLGGDPEILTDDKLFMGVSGQIGALIEIENAVLEKL